MSTPLSVLNLTIRAQYCLKRGRVYDVETLRAMEARDILSIPEVGKKTLQEINLALAEYESTTKPEGIGMNLREAAEMALNHLTNLQPYLGNGLLNKTQLAFVEPNIDEAMKKLRQALAMEKFSEVNQEIEEAIKKGTKAWADVADATEWVDDLRGTDFSGALKPPLTCLETPGIVDLDKYYSVTYKSPLGASVYDVDGVKWLIENRGADYFTRDVKKVDMSEEHVEKSDKSIQEREWVGLSDDDIWEIYKKHDSMQYQEFARAVEAKLKEKNGG